MLPRAELLWRAGYVVLMPDLQAHGQSTGDRISFGYLEARDAQACLRYLRERFPGLRGVRGASHDDLFRFDKAGYAAHVLDFLDRHLAGERARP
jgi:alpha/beta superfamily hydrolase